MHPLLERQIRRYVDASGIERDQIHAFLAAIEAAYEQADQDRILLERSLDLTSQELESRNADLRRQLRTTEDTRLQLERSLSLLNATLESTGEGLLVVDSDGVIVRCNVLGTEILALRTPLMEGQHFADICHELCQRAHDAGRLRYHLQMAQMQQENTRYGQFDLDDGTIIEFYTAPHRLNGSVAGRVWCFRNVTEIHRNQQLAEQALHDPLTGLPNRQLLLDRLQHALKKAERNDSMVAVLFMDLDNFKNVNDSIGHQYGDQLLIEVSQRLSMALREQDTLARLGGDEFVVLMEDLEQMTTVAPVAERLIRCFDNLFRLGTHQLFLTTSIGITIYPNDSQDVDGLISKADLAMYHAKNMGKNQYQFFARDLEQAALRRIEIEGKLRAAMREQQFQLYYQPKVSAVEGYIVGMEALIRWQLPSGEFVSPVEFIPIAEQTGIIHSLGNWVLEEACRQLAEWRERGIIAESVAVNLSALQLQDVDLPRRVQALLERHRLPGAALEVEITESMLMKHMEPACNVLDRLRSLGIQVAIDDFGTGYSSLNYLRRLPIDCLKIDRSFVIDLETSEDARAIAASIISLAHNLRLQVVAEGVETAAMIEVLCQLGCDVMQGYHFSRPVPAPDMGLLLQHPQKLGATTIRFKNISSQS